MRIRKRYYILALKREIEKVYSGAWRKVRMFTSENVRFPSVSSSPYVCSPVNKEG